MRVAGALGAALAAGAAAGACQLVSGVGDLEIVAGAGGSGTTTTTTGAGGSGGSGTTSTPTGSGGASTGGGGSGGATTGTGGASTDGGAGGQGGTATTSTCPPEGGEDGCGPTEAKCGGPSCIDLRFSGGSCGACGVDCKGPACSNGVCGSELVLESEGDVQQVAVNATHVVWATGNSDTIRAKPLGGSPAFTVKSLLGFTPHGLAADATYAYFGSWNPGGAIYRVEIKQNAGAPKAIASATVPKPNLGVWQIVLDDGWVYWTAYAGVVNPELAQYGGVRRAPADGSGQAEILAEGLPEAFGLVVEPGAAGGVWFTSYDTENDAGIVCRVSKDNKKNVAVVASVPTTRLGRMARFGDTLYVAAGSEPGSSEIIAVPMSGGPWETAYVIGDPVMEVGRAGPWLYVSTWLGVQRVMPSCAGASPQMVSPEPAPVLGFAATATDLYYTMSSSDPGGGSLYRTSYAAP